MGLINGLLSTVTVLLSFILPVFGVSDSFFVSADNAMASFITIIEGANWFVPLDTLVICFSAMVIVDNFAFLTKVALWVAKLVRG
ncbi:MAG TPA: hypothetical protein VIK86_10355 [Candidatus Paceibacterota bacterium]